MVPGATALQRMPSADMVDGDGAGERRDGAFRGAVGGAVADADRGDDRGGVDDGAAAVFRHRRDGVLRAQVDAAHVDRHEVVPGLLVGVDDRAGEAVAGVVDEHVEAAEGLAPSRCTTRCASSSLDTSIIVGDHRRAGGRPSAATASAASCALVGDDDARAFACEEQAGGAADARAAAGDDADFSFKPHGLPPCPSPSAGYGARPRRGRRAGS